jgi:hypothetical protein
MRLVSKQDEGSQGLFVGWDLTTRRPDNRHAGDRHEAPLSGRLLLVRSVS